MNSIGIALGMMTLICNAEADWVELIPEGKLDAFKKASPKFVWTDKISLDSVKQNKLVAGKDKGAILFNNNEGLPGLVTNQSWGRSRNTSRVLSCKGFQLGH